ncbi:MAG: redoxin family protein [SAR324 cluster bacterium]|nr:redoxin family protein [SAR324 cluster bacterium]
MKKKYQDKGLQVIGIHTPEFDFEKERARVVKAAQRFDLKHPIMMDNDYAFWKALNNSYWPAFYLVNQEGEIVLSSVGEMHEGGQNPTRFESQIKKMLSM